MSFNLAKHFNKYLITTALLIGFVEVSYATILNIDKNATLDQFKEMVLIDASSLSSCQKDSVKAAKCIPANTFQSEQGELASFYHITWVFGTAGIQGSEELLIFADEDNQRDALLGLFYLSGHKKVLRWTGKKSDLQKRLREGPGQTRSIVRSKYYTAKMRDSHLALPNNVEALKKQGWKISAEDKLTTKHTIVVGKQPLESLARFTRLFMKKTKNQMLKILTHSPISKLQTSKSPS